MNFYIKKLHIWFRPDEERRTIEFENNKVNVITGSSSKGKSNILAIIDYCLLSTKPRIVYPVINEYAEWYGLEFAINGKYYAIARKKPTEETAESNIFRQNEEFSDEFYPNTANVQISDLRRELDLKFSLKEEYRTPHVDGVEDPRVSFRSFFIYNALTETIMTNPHFFTDYNYFDKGYVDSKKMRAYLFDVLLGMDNIVRSKRLAKIAELTKLKDQVSKNGSEIAKHTQKFFAELQNIKAILSTYGLFEDWCSLELSPIEWIELIEKTCLENKPAEKKDLDKDVLEMRDKLNQLIRMRDNINEARREMSLYLNQQNILIDTLKPVEYLKSKMPLLGNSYLTSHIIDAFEKALNDELCSRKELDNAEIIQKDRYDQLEQEICSLKEKIRVATNKAELLESKRQEFFYVIGLMESHLKELKRLYGKIPLPIDASFPEEKETELNVLKNEEKEYYPQRASALDNLNNTFQKIYDDFLFMEYYQGCYTKYALEEERLMLNRGKSAFNEENIGSQSNYMFLHLCFFLGLHRYLADHPSHYISNFLFIDQPSIPYYAGADNVKTTDKDKLIDAFESINRFMHYVVDEKQEQFQIIMIEHAPEEYWVDSETTTPKESLDLFVTTEKFEEDNALIPMNIVNSRLKENEA